MGHVCRLIDAWGFRQRYFLTVGANTLVVCALRGRLSLQMESRHMADSEALMHHIAITSPKPIFQILGDTKKVVYV